MKIPVTNTDTRFIHLLLVIDRVSESDIFPRVVDSASNFLRKASNLLILFLLFYKLNSFYTVIARGLRNLEERKLVLYNQSKSHSSFRSVKDPIILQDSQQTVQSARIICHTFPIENTTLMSRTIYIVND